MTFDELMKKFDAGEIVENKIYEYEHESGDLMQIVFRKINGKWYEWTCQKAHFNQADCDKAFSHSQG